MSNATFNVPPGWPPMPAGWTPPAGWTSPAHWPAPPDGWEFWTLPPVQPSTVYGPPAYPSRMVTKQTKDTSHVFHLIMSVLTLGLWAVFVWLPIIVWHKLGPRSKAVTRAR